MFEFQMEHLNQLPISIKQCVNMFDTFFLVPVRSKKCTSNFSWLKSYNKLHLFSIPINFNSSFSKRNPKTHFMFEMFSLLMKRNGGKFLLGVGRNVLKLCSLVIKPNVQKKKSKNWVMPHTHILFLHFTSLCL